MKIAFGVCGAVALLQGVIGVFLLTRDGGSDEVATVTTTATTTTTVIPVGPPWPLTGLPSAPGEPLDRPAVAVKISNGDDARPQVGINVADQVWEEQVEGISRLIAVFHSRDAAPVGPVRSARDTDLGLLGAFGTPVFVWGGANVLVAARVAASPLVSFNVDPASAENNFRDEERLRPNNLFIDGIEPFFASEGASAAVAQFGYRDGEDPPGGDPALGATIDWFGSKVSYLWDESRGGWARFQNGTPHVDADGELVAPDNVAVLFTEYGTIPSNPNSPIGNTVGEGEATVFSAGRQIAARWSRPNDTSPYVITASATGLPVLLTPGTTWVALARPGRAAFLDEPEAEVLRTLLAELELGQQEPSG